jgi:hypothetical protein
VGSETLNTGFGTIAALLAVIAVSVWLGTQAQKAVERGSFMTGYFLGNRGLGAWALALTATVQSGGTFMGFPSLIYTHGWIVAVWIGSYMVVPITGFVARWPTITGGESCVRLLCLRCAGRVAAVALRHPRGLNGGLSHADLRLGLIEPGWESGGDGAGRRKAAPRSPPGRPLAVRLLARPLSPVRRAWAVYAPHGATR